jgi:hypothetical protein
MDIIGLIYTVEIRLACGQIWGFVAAHFCPNQQKMISSLMFVSEQHGKAGEAIDQYLSIFEDASILAVERYGQDDDGPKSITFGRSSPTAGKRKCAAG